MKQRLFRKIAAYLSGTSGAIAIAFAIMAPVVIGASGMALDYARAYLVQQRLAQAIDAAALAAAASSTDADVIEQRVLDFFAANYPPEKLGVTFTPHVTVTDNDIEVSASAQYNTFFLRLLGIDTVDVEAETAVRREVQGLEVALVLDNTGSMSTNNNIASLKQATQSFINILFDRTTDPESIKIGLVPYANAVRVGRYGLGQNPDGTTYGDGRSFVTLPQGYTYTTNHNHSSATQWYGCVIEYNEDGWNPGVATNDPYPHDVLDDYEGPWDIYRYESWTVTGQTCTGSGNRRRCTNNYDYRTYSYPAQNCPYANIVPLTSDQDQLLAAVNTMTAHGNTLGNIGMAWGARVISPEFPFTEGVDWENERWRKAVVMMTDGDNTRDSYYSAFWRARANTIDVTDYNERFVETCNALKEQGVTVYTVTFYSNINENTKQYYRDCASSENQYYDAPTQDELIEVFETISRELSNLHITR